MYWSMRLPAWPPYSLGQEMPIHPRSAISLYISRVLGPRPTDAGVLKLGDDLGGYVFPQ